MSTLIPKVSVKKLSIFLNLVSENRRSKFWRFDIIQRKEPSNARPSLVLEYMRSISQAFDAQLVSVLWFYGENYRDMNNTCCEYCLCTDVAFISAMALTIAIIVNIGEVINVEYIIWHFSKLPERVINRRFIRDIPRGAVFAYSRTQHILYIK